MALMVASVPELTKRTSSMDGHEFDDAARELRLQFGRSAEAQAVGGDVLHGLRSPAGAAWPRIIGPQEPT